MTFSNLRDKENLERVRGFLLAGGAEGERVLRKLEQEQAVREIKVLPSAATTSPRCTANEKFIHQAEVMAGLVEELSERLHLMRDELWQLRAELAQGVER